MAVAKIDQFSKTDVRLAEVAKALGHPARIRILSILANLNVCMCGDIVERLPLSQATVSQHLKALKQAGIIQGNIDGPKTCYCIDNSVLKTIRELFIALFDEVCCGSGC